METIVKFEVGNIYEMRFIGDSNLKPHFICVKITEKTASFERYQKPSDKFTKKKKVSNNAEYVLYDTYSMAPIIRATSIVG